MRIKRESWKGKYKIVARDSKGHFLRGHARPSWSSSWTVSDYKKDVERIERPRVYEVTRPEGRYFHVHAKVDYRSKRGKSYDLQLEAYMYVQANDIEAAKDILSMTLQDRFGEGMSEMLEQGLVSIKANEVTSLQMEKKGKIMWRSFSDSRGGRKPSWRQDTITSYY